MTALAHPVLADRLPAVSARGAALARDAALVVAGTATVAVVGQVAIPLPFTPVPLTLGTLAVLLVGAALGPVRGAASMLLLLAAGLLGAPVFAGGASGWALASFGYVLGYVPAAALLGALARRRADRSVRGTAVAAVLATGVVYLFGVPWLMAFTGATLQEGLVMGVVPFVVGDVIKAVAAAVLLPGAWRLLGER